jgi:putative phage-type endonuclease
MDPYKKKLRRKVRALQKKPQPEQRTPEWFKQRQTRITASEAASCLFKSQKVCEPYVREFNISNFKYKDNEPLNPYETKEDYIIKKCSAFYGKSVFRDNPATLWGKKYEEVANRLYSKIKQTKVFEFGLLSHARLKWLAASPDGITADGVMLEIKCPKSRKIDPSAPPLYYWIQVQIQLESTDLEFCDFLECEIEELSCEQEFLAKQPLGNQDIGIVLQIMDSGPEPKFIYPPLEIRYQSTIHRLDEQDTGKSNQCDADLFHDYKIQHYPDQT